jgi:hypothetical protein
MSASTFKCADHDPHVEVAIVTALAVSGDFIRRLKAFWQDDLIQAPELRRVARWCFDHLERCGRAPGTAHLTSVFFAAVKADQLGKDEAEFIEAILTNMSDRYGDGSEFDVKFAYNQALAYFGRRALEQHTEQLRDFLDRGQVDEAAAAARSFRPLAVDEDSLASMAPTVIRWLWEGRIALGKTTLVTGGPDLGKSTLLLDIAARVSSGGRWPDGRRCRKRAVLIASAEDDFADTVVPRLKAAGADLGLCYEIGKEAANIDALGRRSTGRWRRCARRSRSSPPC